MCGPSPLPPYPRFPTNWRYASYSESRSRALSAPTTREASTLITGFRLRVFTLAALPTGFRLWVFTLAALPTGFRLWALALLTSRPRAPLALTSRPRAPLA
jgi:hypothetical protein